MAKRLEIGKLTNVRDWEGQVLERRIVSACGNLVFVCTDEEFKKAKEERRDPATVGWPVEDAGL